MQYSVQDSAVQCTVQCSAVYSTVQCSVQYSAVQCSVQCYAVQCTVQCSTVQHNTAQTQGMEGCGETVGEVARETLNRETMNNNKVFIDGLNRWFT